MRGRRRIALAGLLAAACGSVTSAGDDAGAGQEDGGAADLYVIGGTVTGLTGQGLEVQLGTEIRPVEADGPFFFNRGLAPGTGYGVAIAAQPAGQTCAITNEIGTVGTADVEDIEIVCYASVFVVDALTDEPDAGVDGTCDTGGGDCTLRAAVQEASASAADDLILLPDGTVLFTLAGVDETDPATGDLDLAGGGAIRLVGGGADATVIDGNDVTGIFDVMAGTEAIIERLTIQNGDSMGYGGGGLRVRPDGSATLRDAVVRSHAGGINGAAIYNEGPLAIVRSRITDNESSNGGGMMARGPFTVRDSLIDGNRAMFRGGGIWDDADGEIAIEIRNTTVTGNSAGGSDAEGGGGLNLDHPAVLVNLTITGNQALGAGATGGGLYTSGGSELTNSIVAGNGAAGGAPDCAGPVATGGHNLVGDATGCELTAADGDLLGSAEAPIDALLGPLEAIGRTLGHLPMAGSPAIDAGDPAACPTHDQAGRPRQACDIGALEALP